MSDICKCRHEKKLHVAVGGGCVWSEATDDYDVVCVCKKYEPGNPEVERMADVVSAALRWRQVVMAKELPSSECDCVFCTLVRACDKYTSESA